MNIEYLRFYILSLFGVVPVSSLEIASIAPILSLSMYGLDLKKCTKIVFQIKSCENFEFGLYDIHDNEWMKYSISRSGYIQLDFILPHITSAANSLYGDVAISCTEFRSYYFTFFNGKTKFGIGNVTNENRIFEYTTRKPAYILKLKSNGDTRTMKFDGTGRFEKEVIEGIFADDELSYDYVTFANCANRCLEDVDCGLFSYNEKLSECRLYEVRLTMFPVMPENGWQSWKLLYCYW